MSSRPIRFRRRAQAEADQLEEPATEAAALAKKLGLDPYPVNYWIVGHDEMNQLIAYGGFQRRYPHWRWGMTYDRQQKQDQFGMGKAFEIVNNDDPSHAFLQESNSLADQKAVITHVEGHADFFKNNNWFSRFSGDQELDAAAMLERHGETIQGYVDDPDIDRDDVERFIDAVLCLEDTIDQHRPVDVDPDTERTQPTDLRDQLDQLDLSDDVQQQVFDQEWLDDLAESEAASASIDHPRTDVLGFLRDHATTYDDEEDEAVAMESWQLDILDTLRREAYYFAPQKMTKVMNEGWASIVESLMMSDEGFADADEFITYADHQSRVLGSPGLNPYKLGKELWEYVENSANRREVADKLLRVEGITWQNFHAEIDFEHVRALLEPDPRIDAISSDTVEQLTSLPGDDPRIDWEMLDRALSNPETVDIDRYPWKVLSYEGLAERHFSLVQPQHRGFLEQIRRSELQEHARYLFDDTRYDTVEDAIDDVDKTAGWDRMREVRESHNDVTFIDEFLTQEFVSENNYFTYEYTQTTEDYRVASTDYQDVKQKLLLQFTNFGKPTIAVFDDNFKNRGELLLGHRYNGIALDIQQATAVLERMHDLWGRPVNLMTITKTYEEHEVEVARRRNREPEPTETGVRLRYDGHEVTRSELDNDLTDRIRAADIDYDTKPDEWLA